MQNSFNIKIIDVTEKALSEIGFDKTYTEQGLKKHLFKSLKICNLSCAQANILKQTALSAGTDCAVHREVITGKVEKSDCILSGTENELLKISEKLSKQPFRLKLLGEHILTILKPTTHTLNVRKKTIQLEEPFVMGILNITPDSFSDGGSYNNVDKAVEHFKKLVSDGADIVDIGGESTRPGAAAVSIEEETRRIIPVLEKIRKFDKETIISVDTRNAKTAELALSKGADIINDISAFEWDSDMLKTVQAHNCPVVITHSAACEDCSDIISEIYGYFANKTEYLINQGFNQNNIILDPGICFGKTAEQNLEIINRIKELKSLNYPILIGHSRKSFIQKMFNTTETEILDDATLLISQKLVEQGTSIVRVHNVKKHSLLKQL